MSISLTKAVTRPSASSAATTNAHAVSKGGPAPPKLVERSPIKAMVAAKRETLFLQEIVTHPDLMRGLISLSFLL
jgi:hypothetical protein